MIEEREVLTTGLPPAFPIVIGAVGFGAGGAVIGGIFSEEVKGAILGGGLGALLGVATTGVMLPFAPKIRKTRKIGTDKARYQELPKDRTTKEEILNELLIYENNPASNINVKLSGDGGYKMYITDEEGEELQVLIQDDLSGLEGFLIKAEGNIGD